jgi:hypothetical protein
LLTWLFVSETKRAEEAREKFRKSGKRVDWLGIALFIGGIAAFELLLEKGVISTILCFHFASNKLYL